MPVLALETSCDETGAAVAEGGRVLSNRVSSQTRLHADYGGVVPELAAREHLRNLRPVVRETLDQARVGPGDLTAVAATQGPGLPSALLVGFKAAQILAYSIRRPFIGIHHHEAHLYSPWIEGPSLIARFDMLQPSVSLIVSGGHTLLVHVSKEGEHRVLGSTVDDAAGECFDKVAKLLGLAYPGGPEIDRFSESGNPLAFRFPRPMLNDSSDDFSFSGLKTAVRYFLRDNPHVIESRAGLCDVCASVQAALVEVLVGKTVKAARRLRVRCVTVSGGVTCNRALRRELALACAREGQTLRLAEPSLCTDNAAMVAVLAERKLARGDPPTSLDSDPRPGWSLDEIQ